MKYIAIILLGLVLLATICGVVLWANMPTAKLTVHAVRPMGTNVWLSSQNPEDRWPLWEFAITNTGRSPATWTAYLHFKDGEHEWADTSAWNFDPPLGVLSPGESAKFKFGVPPDSRTNWAVTAKYWPHGSPVETRLYGWLACSDAAPFASQY